MQTEAAGLGSALGWLCCRLAFDSFLLGQIPSYDLKGETHISGQFFFSKTEGMMCTYSTWKASERKTLQTLSGSQNPLSWHRLIASLALCSLLTYPATVSHPTATKAPNDTFATQSHVVFDLWALWTGFPSPNPLPLAPGGAVLLAGLPAPSPWPFCPSASVLVAQFWALRSFCHLLPAHAPSLPVFSESHSTSPLSGRVLNEWVNKVTTPAPHHPSPPKCVVLQGQLVK